MSGRGRGRDNRRRDGYRKQDGGEGRGGGRDFRGRRRGGFDRKKDYEEEDREKDQAPDTPVQMTRVFRKDRYPKDAEVPVSEEKSDPNPKPVILAKSSRAVEREKAEKLDQEFPALKKSEETPTKDGKDEEDTPGIIMVKQRESARSGSPATPSPRIIGKKEIAVDRVPAKLTAPVKLVDESHAFCDGIADFMTDNTDFTVIGVLGLQSTGKSTILNLLAKSSPEDDEIFKVQSYEHQMLAEHCTNGIDVYVNSRRHIFLDCQPLLSSSIMDRAIQLEKKFNAEFSTAENTIEVQSLQLIGFIFSVCHTVLLVQDWFLDPSLIRLMQAAETLKPVTPTISGEDNQLTEYFPHMVLVHNKCEVADFEDDMVDEIKEMYGMLWAKSRLNWKEEDGDTPHIVMIPDQEGERADALQYRIRPRIDYEKAGRNLRQQVFTLPRKPLSQGKLTEKAWSNLASKTWDNIKNSPFYMEYSRLLP